MNVDTRKARLFAPASEEEAARFLDECTRLESAGCGGATIALTIAESPVGFPLTGGDYCAAGEALEHIRRGEPVVLSHAGLAGVREVSRADLLVRAGGGTPLAEIETAAREAGLYFPHFDASCRDDLTLAALLMEAPVSPLAGAYGGLRESVLALRLVTGGGETIHSGSRAVKDVAGYEIIGFVLGAGGRCGMISEATLRLLPAPRTIVRAVLGGDYAELAGLARRIRERRHASAAVLFGSRAAARLAALFPAGLTAAGRPEQAGVLPSGGRPQTPVCAVPPAGRPAPEADVPVAEDSPAALLHVEVHAAAHGAEDEIRGEICALASRAGVSVSGAEMPDGAPVPDCADLRRALIGDLCAGAGQALRRVLHVSYDQDDGPLEPPDPLGWRDCFLPRAHMLAPLASPAPGAVAHAQDPLLARAGGKRRWRVELLEARAGRIAGAWLEHENGQWPGGDAVGVDPSLGGIRERVLRVFDPAGVLRP